jgi:hypothetical protein
VAEKSLPATTSGTPIIVPATRNATLRKSPGSPGSSATNYQNPPLGPPFRSAAAGDSDAAPFRPGKANGAPTRRLDLGTGQIHVTDEQWRNRIRNYFSTAYWNEFDWGNKPDDYKIGGPPCYAPKEIRIEEGCEPSTDCAQ